jgi:hypothetical protein
MTASGRCIDGHIVVDSGLADNRRIVITNGAFRAEYTREVVPETDHSEEYRRYNSDYYIHTITGEWIDVSPIRDHERIDAIFYAYLEARGEQW